MTPDEQEPAPPNLLHSRQVEAMAGYGITAEDIATVLGIEPETLRLLYAEDLDTGHAARSNGGASRARNLFRSTFYPELELRAPFRQRSSKAA